MFAAFWPIFLFFLFLLAVAGVLIGMGYIWNPRRPNPVKAMPYESGMDLFHDARRRFDVRFYLLAIAFLVFDVGVLLLYPWAVAARAGHQGLLCSRVNRSEATSFQDSGSMSESMSESAPESRQQYPQVGIDAAVQNRMIQSRGLVLAGALAFIGLLAVGYVYDWRKGILRWR